MVVLKEEVARLDKLQVKPQSQAQLQEPSSPSISHEKEHIRTIFSKFMESLSQG